jgi:hypothetical protein
MILLVILERNPFREVPEFLETLKRARRVKRLLRGTWAIETSLAPEVWAARLTKHIKKTDALLVIQARGNYDGYLERPVLEWLGAQVTDGTFDDASPGEP